MFAVFDPTIGMAIESHLTEQQADDWWDSIDSYCTNAGRTNTCQVIEHGPDASFEYV